MKEIGQVTYPNSTFGVKPLLQLAHEQKQQNIRAPENLDCLNNRILKSIRTKFARSKATVVR